MIIHKFISFYDDLVGVVRTLLGGGFYGGGYQDGTGTNAVLAGPRSIVVSSSGQLFFTDSNRVIRSVSPEGEFFINTNSILMQHLFLH